MKRLISLPVVAATAISAAAGGITADQAMSQYVYPQNAAESVAIPVYLPGERQVARLGDDGRSVVASDLGREDVAETLLDLSKTREVTLDSIEGFTVSPDGSKILVWMGKQMIYRRSFRAKYYVYDRHSRILMPLSKESETQRSPIFSPDGRMVAFTADDNNIHIRKLDYNTEVAVTTDGEVNAVINGVPDWTYEEEFATTCSMAWAPDNLTLCYVRYDEREVPLYSFPLYEGACKPDSRYALYPGSFDYKYPVAGMPNSKVSLHSYDVETRKIKRVDLPSDRVEYIPRIDFAGAPDRLVATTLNRDQNRMELFTVNPRSAQARTLMVEEKRNGWIEPEAYADLRFYSDFFVINSSRSGWNHLYRYGYSGAMESQLTSGDYDVTAYYGYSPSARAHYFQSTRTGSVNRVVSRLDAKGRVTDLTKTNGWGEAAFSPDATSAMLWWSDVNHAPVYTLVNPATGKTLLTLEDNADVTSRYASAPRREFVTIPADAEGPALNAYVIRPADFDASRSYPVIMTQYSGPGSQEVRDRWSMDWENYYAMQGFIIVCVDGRGTGGRGREFREAVYRNLGHYETIDQLRGARFAASLPGADASRIGIYGWSYGGYETLMAASAEGAPFKAAVAVAPVTDWRYYDTVYAARYMLPPSRNPEGYMASAPLNRIGSLNCRLLIMHGTADDNVHLSNTMEYVSRLIAAGKYCDMLLFPNMNHSINGCDTRLMVYSRMLDYFQNNL